MTIIIINHPLKKALNREIQNYGHVMNEIKYRLRLPNVKKVTLKFGFFQRKNRLKNLSAIFILSVDLIGIIMYTFL